MHSSAAKGKGKGKGKARGPSPGLVERTDELDAINNHQDEISRDEHYPHDPLSGLQPMEHSSGNCGFGDQTPSKSTGCDFVPQDHSEEDFDASQTENDGISALCTRLRAMEERDARLAHDATPGASGSGSGPGSRPHFRRCAPDSVRARTIPVVHGQPAFKKPSVQPGPSVPPPPREASRSVLAPLPKVKDRTIARVKECAGLSGNAERWNRINGIIRRIMTKKAIDYSGPWKDQDETEMNKLYDEILEKVPELRDFEDNWGVIELVRKKFNNESQKSKKENIDKLEFDDANERRNYAARRSPAPSSNRSPPQQLVGRSSTLPHHSCPRPFSPQRTGSNPWDPPRSPSPPRQSGARPSTPQPSRHSQTGARDPSPSNMPLSPPRPNSPPPDPNPLQPAPPHPRPPQRPLLVDYGSSPSPPPNLAQPQPPLLPPVDPRPNVQEAPRPGLEPRPNSPDDPPVLPRQPTPNPGPNSPEPPRTPPPPYFLVDPQTPRRPTPPPLYAGLNSPTPHRLPAPAPFPRRSMRQLASPRNPPPPVAGPSRQPRANTQRRSSSPPAVLVSSPIPISPILITSSSPPPESAPSQNKKRKRKGSERRGKKKRMRNDESDYSPSDGTEGDDGGQTSSSQDL